MAQGKSRKGTSPNLKGQTEQNNVFSTLKAPQKPKKDFPFLFGGETDISARYLENLEFSREMLLGERCGRGVSFYSMGILTWTRNSSSLPSSRGYGLISTTEPCEAVFLISETPLAEKSPKLHYGERLKPNSLALA